MQKHRHPGQWFRCLFVSYDICRKQHREFTGEVARLSRDATRDSWTT